MTTDNPGGNRGDALGDNAGRGQTQPVDRGVVACSPTKDDTADELVAVVEQLFFAYRDFIADPDALLGGLGYGRAHHRVLHFVNRNPGLRVADLLDILQITKQSLARVLKQLIDEGYIEQHAGEHDRRERLLHPTAKGAALFAQLLAPQVARVKDALAMANLAPDNACRVSPEAAPAAEQPTAKTGHDAVERFLKGMTGPRIRPTQATPRART